MIIFSENRQRFISRPSIYNNVFDIIISLLYDALNCLFKGFCSIKNYSDYCN
ncbi:hypothetical protein MCEKH37_01180 [Methylophilaceae bacterium]